MLKLTLLIIVVVASFSVVIISLPRYLGPDGLKDCPAKPSISTTCQSADAIVAISGGDTLARANEAIKLYQNGWAPLLIFSGAAQDKTGPSNAEVMQTYAIAKGVPKPDILIDNFASDTSENAKNTVKFSRKYNLKRIILVTSAYHQRRADLEFKAFFGPSVQIVDHPVAHDKQWHELWWLTPIGWWLAISELVKITILSFVTHVR